MKFIQIIIISKFIL